MRTFAVLLSLSLIMAAGCGTESSTTLGPTTTSTKPLKLDTVDAATFGTLTSSKPVVMLEFTADW